MVPATYNDIMVTLKVWMISSIASSIGVRVCKLCHKGHTLACWYVLVCILAINNIHLSLLTNLIYKFAWIMQTHISLKQESTEQTPSSVARLYSIGASYSSELKFHYCSRVQRSSSWEVGLRPTSAARRPCTCCGDVGIVVQRSLISWCTTAHACWLLPSISIILCMCVQNNIIAHTR